MATGTFGLTRPSDVSISDIEIYINYMADRYTSNNDMTALDPTELLEYCYLPTDDPNAVGTDNILEGLYNLKMPATIFNQLGVYTIYIKPKMTNSVIVDCSVLSALPNVNGIIIDISSLPEALRANNALQGYRIEYLNSDGTKLRNVVRYIVSANKVDAISENVGNTSQKAIRYRFNDAGTLMFLQVTPSSASSVKPNASLFIGNVGQTILLSNTFFSPLTLEVEMVQNDLDTISQLVSGEQIKDVENGILSYFDETREIMKQFNLFTIKDSVSGQALYEVKEKRTTIDVSQTFNNVTNGL